MSGNFQKKTTNVFLTLFIGFIVISFMFTGYESMRGTPDTVAVVGDQNIAFREYQSEFNRQIEFYSKFIQGGQALSSKQIADFNIKQNAIKSLVQSRLSTILGEELGVTIPKEEIRQTIKEQEFFQTNKQFDLEKYKAILRANALSPTDYEQNVERELVSTKTNTLLSGFPVSKQFLADIQKFKQQKRVADVIRLSKDEVASLLEISKAEISAFLADNENTSRVQSLFSERKPGLDIQETVEARHILVQPKEGESDADLKKRIDKIAAQTTAKNFAAMAKKFTEEPGGNERGGSLGAFGKGRMVPAFEKVAFELPVGKVSAPVKTDFGYHLILVEKKTAAKEATFEAHKEALASELIRKQKTDETKKLVEEVAADIQKALASGSKKQIDALATHWKLNHEAGVEINRYDGAKGKIFLETAQLNKIFANEGEGVERFENAANITFVKSKPDTSKSTDTATTPTEDAQSTKLAYSNKMRQEMLTKLGDDVQVRVYDNRMP